MLAELVVSTRSDGAVGLNKHRRWDAVKEVVSQCHGMRYLGKERFCLHGVEQDTVEMLVLGANILYEAVSSTRYGGGKYEWLRRHLPYQTK